MTPDPDNFARRARALYLEASRQVDPSAAERLRAARRRALAATHPAPARFASRLLLPAGAFAVLALATLMIWQPLRHADNAVPHAASSAQAADADADLPPDADSADPQLYQNLDFYDWLAANDSAQPRH
jgi:type II secretory pathway component PulM